jgi:hypothetical protein
MDGLKGSEYALAKPSRHAGDRHDQLGGQSEPSTPQRDVEEARPQRPGTGEGEGECAASPRLDNGGPIWLARPKSSDAGSFSKHV